MKLRLCICAAALLFGSAAQARFNAGDVFAITTNGGIFNVTGGGDFTGANPLASLGCCIANSQAAWSGDLETMYVADYFSGSVLAVSSSGAVSTFASGLGLPTGLLRTSDSRLLVSAIDPLRDSNPATPDESRVIDITKGGNFFPVTTPFAYGVETGLKLTQLQDGRILWVAGGGLLDITMGGNVAGNVVASGFDGSGDIVQTAAGRLLVSATSSLTGVDHSITDITALGNQSGAPPWVTGYTFDALAQDATGRLLAGGYSTQEILNATAGGIGVALPVFATGFGVNNGVAVLDVVPQAIAAVPEPSTYAMLAAGLALLGVLARRRWNIFATPRR